MTTSPDTAAENATCVGCTVLVLVYLALTAIEAVAFYAAWNLAVVPLFGAPPMGSVWQALGLLVVLNIVIGLLKKVIK